MTKIKRLVHQIDDELCSAKKYAEKSLEYKASGNSQRANAYKEMANDEIKHANLLHDIAVQDIAELQKTYTPSVDMQDKWDRAHKEYVERLANIKMMLTL